MWSIDFKGWFRTGDGTRVDPLTVQDAASRYLIACQGLERPTGPETRRALARAFQEYGLPQAIRTDNGPPFAGVGLGSLSPLSAWWIKLGIVPERIEPGHPEQNGRLKWKGDRVYVSESLRGEPIGLVQQDERTWSIQFGPLLIGVLDDHARRIDKTSVHVLPNVPGLTVTHVPGRTRAIRESPLREGSGVPLSWE